MNAPPLWALCAFCGQDRKAHNGSLGAFLGPLDDGNRSGVGAYVHRDCALWSSEVYHNSDGTKLRKVGQAIRRGRQLRCGYCGERGATLGCRLERCNVSYHLPCARASGCEFFYDKYLIACPRHVAEFKRESGSGGRRQPYARGLGDAGGGAAPTRVFFSCVRQPPTGEALEGCSYAPDADHLPALGRLPRGQAFRGVAGAGAAQEPQVRREDGVARQQKASKRRKIDYDVAARHIAVASAALASACATAAATAAAPAEADDDEAVFAVKERRRHAKDIAKLAPVMLGNETSTCANGEGGGGRGFYSKGFECVGGLQPVIQSLREMVLLPLLHPGLMERLGVGGAAPPRGILLHGLPGTGKTLIVRALAGEVARRSPVPVALFARGGADVLGKYHGDAERTLRLLFEEARRRAPSIIFLDELDALAPRRSDSAGGADQIYASVVSTLLALMDGVADRGQVVVIGATNRPDNLDPALRRPGRFDREVGMGLPCKEDRAAVLRVHTAGWSPPLPDGLIDRIAEATEGFAGADLAALCSSTVMAALRRAASSAATSISTSAITTVGPDLTDVAQLLLNARQRQQRAETRRQQKRVEEAHQQPEDQKPQQCGQVGGQPRSKANEGQAPSVCANDNVAAPVGAPVSGTSPAVNRRLQLGPKCGSVDADRMVIDGDIVSDHEQRRVPIAGCRSNPVQPPVATEMVTTMMAARGAEAHLLSGPSRATGQADYEEMGPSVHPAPAPLVNMEHVGGDVRVAAASRKQYGFASALRTFCRTFDNSTIPAEQIDSLHNATSIASSDKFTHPLDDVVRAAAISTLDSTVRGDRNIVWSAATPHFTEHSRGVRRADSGDMDLAVREDSRQCTPGGDPSASPGRSLVNQGVRGIGAGPLRGRLDTEKGRGAEGNEKEEEKKDVSEDWLAELRVEETDWEVALATAPKPCSQRDAAAAVSAAGPPPLPPSYLAALVAPAAAVALLWFAAAGVAVPAAVMSTAAVVAAAAIWQSGDAPEVSDVQASSPLQLAGNDTYSAIMAFLRLLISMGAVEGPPSSEGMHIKDEVVTATSPASAAAHQGYATAGRTLHLPTAGSLPTKMLHRQPQLPLQPRSWSRPTPCHLLLCGLEGMGQEVVAAIVLRLLCAPHTQLSQASLAKEFHPGQHPHPLHGAGPSGTLGTSGVSVHTINLPSIILRSGGASDIEDTASGLASLVSEALAPIHGSRGQLQVLYLPAIDTWALEQHVDLDFGTGKVLTTPDAKMDGNESDLNDELQVVVGDVNPVTCAAAKVPRYSRQCSPPITVDSGGGKAERQEENDADLSDTDGDENKEEEGGVVEALPCSRTCISPAWSVFMQQVSAAEAGLCRPTFGLEGLSFGAGLLVLATCALPPNQLPSEVLEFFGSRQLTESVISRPEATQGESVAPELYELSGQQTQPACRHIITLLPPPAIVMEAAAAEAKAAVLPFVMRELKSCVLHALRDAIASQTTSDTAGARGAETAPDMVAPSMAPAETSHPATEGFPSPPRGDPTAPSVNSAELERGRRLLLQVHIALQGIVSPMLRWGSGCHLARASMGKPIVYGHGITVPPSRVALEAAETETQAGCLDMHECPPRCHRGVEGTLRRSGGAEIRRGTLRLRGVEVVRLVDVAQRAMEGRIHSLDQLRLEVQSVVAIIRSIRTGPAAVPHNQPLPTGHQAGSRHTRAGASGAAGFHAEGPSSGSSIVGYSRATAAACLWEDVVVAACEAASRSLQLDDPENCRLMEAALKHYQLGDRGWGQACTTATVEAPDAALRPGPDGCGPFYIPLYPEGGPRASSLTAGRAATKQGDACDSERPSSVGGSESDPSGMAPCQLPAKTPAADTAAICAAGLVEADAGAVPGSTSLKQLSTVTAVDVAPFLERRVSALIAEVEAQLEARSGLYRRLREWGDGNGGRGGLPAGAPDGSGDSSSSQDLAQPHATLRASGREVVLGSGEDGRGPGLKDGRKGKGGVAALLDGHVKRVATRMLAACECVCGWGKGEEGKELGGDRRVPAYASWVRSMAAESVPAASVIVMSKDASKEDKELQLKAAAEQLAAALEAAAE